MDNKPHVQPLSYKARKRIFLFLFLIFIVSLPFLLLYATGYRFDIARPTTVYSTGGLYIAVERTGAEIYIDGELVRETRTFRKAFYAQNIQPGTHRVHVQAEGYHTWVKELPVSKHLVTEAQAFNLPLVPTVRVIASWQTATGTMVVQTPVVYASTTNDIIATTSIATTTLVRNTEYVSLLARFLATTSTSTSAHTSMAQGGVVPLPISVSDASSTQAITQATTTKESGGVRLFEAGGEVYARWIGSFDSMPYYYCAEDFPPYSSSTNFKRELEIESREPELLKNSYPSPEPLIHPAQTIPSDTACDPVIRLDRKGQEFTSFDFLPGSSDLVVLGLSDGIYVVEIDDRGWQNAQPLIVGEKLQVRIENGIIYVYDGGLIYQVILKNF